MMSIIGIISLPVLLLSLIFIFFHAKFIKLHNEFIGIQDRLLDLLNHKLKLLLFFEQDMPESNFTISADGCLIEKIIELEELLSSFNYSDEDKEELASISSEIDNVQNMYNQSKEELDFFLSCYPGKLFAIYLMGK